MNGGSTEPGNDGRFGLTAPDALRPGRWSGARLSGLWLGSRRAGAVPPRLPWLMALPLITVMSLTLWVLLYRLFRWLG